MQNFKLKSLLLALLLSVSVFSQENVFLNRDFWNTKPTVEIIDEKIKEGNNPSEANSNNFDGVVYAILQNTPIESIIHLQSKLGNDVNKLTHDGRTYLFWAAYKGNVALMKYLINQGAKTNLTDDKGNTILNFAASSGQKNTKVYDICLENGANLKTDLTPKGANALLLSAPYDDNFDLINYFTSKGLNLNSVDKNGNGIFNYVAKTGNINLLNSLLNKGVKGNDNAFIFAAYGTRGNTNNIAFYKYLVSIGLNLKNAAIDGETPLHIVAARNSNLELIKYFLEKGLDVNAIDHSGNTPFINAASKNNFEIITTLFQQVKDINQKNNNGESALALAIANNTPEVVGFLLENKADVATENAKGFYLNSYLVESYSTKNEAQFKQKLRLLTNNGLDVTKKQKNGNTLYHLAVAKNNINLLKIIEPLQIDVNAKNNQGNTALHLAALQAKNTEILKYLIEIGAHKNAVTEFGETALDLALENEILKTKPSNLDFLE